MKSKYVKISLLAILAVVCCVLALIIPVLRAKADDGVKLEGDGNNFLLSETSYDKDEKFVYTATANFESGQAAGIVFGANEEEGTKWVFNIDRVENRVKLIYFYEGGDIVYRTDYFVGFLGKTTEAEKQMVDPWVATQPWIQLKVVITPEDDKVYAEFYADNIRRFAFDEKGEDVTIDLNSLEAGLKYEGGKIGFNCFSAKVSFDDIYYGKSDYSYYTELYRQQYHFTQFAHWNNDPNGLVYYNGYYHLYYQTYPYTHASGAEGWGPCHWGHSRSKDLVHWEHLPVSLLPDADINWGSHGGEGKAWSGSAMVYHPGMSDAVDSLNWFPNGNGTGIFGVYTRDSARQDQVIISSDDGGLTWTKRKIIPQDLIGITDHVVDCRDPKIFPVQKDGDKVTLWGMSVTGMGLNRVWFFKSNDLLNWTAAGGFEAYRPECPDLITLTADDGNTYTVMTFTSRQYLVGQLRYDGTNIIYEVNGKSIGDMPMNDIPYQTMDFGPDSYAAQTFFIDDQESEYYGKTIAVHWFSGVPGSPASIDSGALGAVRKGWNGSGMTIPVEYGLKKVGNGYVLTQTPIVKNSTAFDKTSIYSGTDVQIAPESQNILKDINTHCFELDAKIENPDGADVYFRINMNGNEYTEIGWNKQDGYYVSREHTGDAGLNLGNYRSRHISGAVDGKNLSFYILSDNGGVEVYCDDFKFPFYVLTFSSPYATKAQFFAEGEVTASIKVNEISSVWRKDAQEGETVIYVDTPNVELDKTLTTSKEVMVYATSGADVNWAIESGENVVSVVKTEQGAKFTALNTGSAVVTVSCGNAVKKIDVTVYDGNVDSDITFKPDGKVSGNWLITQDGLVGVQPAGDGFILSENVAYNFTYSANFSLSGAAAAIVFRAKADMSDYIIANYDINGKVVKLWSPRGEISRAEVSDIDVSNITLKAKADGRNVIIYINDREVINVTLSGNEPAGGLLGLNSCAARTTFKSIRLLTENYLETQNVELDKTLTTSKEVVAHAADGVAVNWAIESGEDVVSLVKTEQGAKITALTAGTAVVTVTFGNAVKKIDVTVYDGNVDSDLTFNTDGKVSGNWLVTQDGLLGVKTDGDGFILSEKSADNFTYSANFSLSGAAAALVFRAKADMSDYIIANYDDNAKVVKLWSPRSELGHAFVEDIDVSDITLKVKANGSNVIVCINDREVINVTLGKNEPTEGLLGLNTFAGRTTFKSIEFVNEIYLETENVVLDRTLTLFKEVSANTSDGAELVWAVESGENVVSVEKTETGAKITALGAGSAVVTVSCGNAVKKITVTVYDCIIDSDLTFKADGIVSGNWLMSQDGLVGVKTDGDGFILSENSAGNFTYSANFSLSGAAAAIVFRAKADMSDYLIANYDDYGKVVKLWSPRGEIGKADVEGIDVSNVTLKVKAIDNNVIVYINGNEVINVTLAETEPTEGLFGLNTCAARTTFKSIVLLTEAYTYSGGKLSIESDTAQAITALYNVTLGNVKVNPSFYTVNGRAIEISQTYFETLKTAGIYEFTAVGANSSFGFKVDVKSVPTTVIGDVTVESGSNAVIYIGNITVGSVTLNGVALTDGYSVKDRMLTINSSKLSVGENTLKINDTTITVTVTEQAMATIETESNTNVALIVSLSVGGGVLVLGGAAAVTTVLLLRRKKKNGGND